MASKKKLLQAAAGSAGDTSLDVDGLFSTFLYTGNDGVLDITNNVDLTEKGLVWIKNRDSTTPHLLWSSETTGNLTSVNTDALNNTSLQPTFNNDGFTFPSSSWSSLNASSTDYISWTFRKAEKFFDVVRYSGNGSAQTLSHNLGSTPGMIIVKRTDSAGNWRIFNRSLGATKALAFTNGAEITSSSFWNDTAPTSTQFTIGTDLSDSGTNNYVAYLFAHNDGDGEFGESGDQDIIKCGSYTGNATYGGPAVDLGFEPQFLLIKNASSTKNWVMFDTMRGLSVDGGHDSWFYTNTTSADNSNGSLVKLLPTGFQASGSSFTGVNGDTFIYMAIRKGSLSTPTDATKVFGLQNYSGTPSGGPQTGFVTDFCLLAQVTGTDKWYAGSRLTGTGILDTKGTTSEATNSNIIWDRMDGAWNNNVTGYMIWGWKRAPGFFDVSPYSGTGFASQSHTHNLGVVPEMIWVKDRDSATNWAIYHKDLGLSKVINFDTGVGGTGNQYWGTAAHTASVFKVGSDSDTGGSGVPYMAYLFASCSGVSKVGSFSHSNGSDTNVDCGFSSGARFVLIKNTSDTGNWYIFDTVRGIVSGNDGGLFLNANTAQQSADWIDPLSSGFTVTGAAWSTGTYLFYAIA
tara:strand:+ start:2171 stop:4057 length:1887 start_codon:yes stop_codon:yes gene_type:complete